MQYTSNTLRYIYDKTSGLCHICHQQISLNNHGELGMRGAWEVDHSLPRSKGGKNHINNLYAACIRCNRDKSNSTTRTARRLNGTTRAPFSKAKKEQMRTEYAVAGGLVGGLVGLIGGPVIALLAAGLGAAIGKTVKPSKA